MTMYPWLRAVDEEFAERFRESRLPHALLLSGPRESGKISLANHFTASLLCRENQHPACGSCRSCQLRESGAHPDYQLVTFEAHPKTGDLRKELVIGQVRRLISSLSLTHTFSKRKVALIHPVEAMNVHTANALLKTLEEPPGETVLILVSHDTARLPATIRSRCQNLHVRLPDRKAALGWLCGEQGAERAEAEAALTAAAGSPLKAWRMIADGSTDQYRLVSTTLAGLRSKQISPGEALAGMAEIDPELLWPWISLLAAQELKKNVNERPLAGELARLQSLADQNRRLLPTPVRKDFLLQDWLIQWSRLRD